MKKYLTAFAFVIISADCMAQGMPTLQRNVFMGDTGFKLMAVTPSYNRPTYTPPAPIYQPPLTPVEQGGYSPPPPRSLGNMNERKENRGLDIIEPVYQRKPSFNYNE